MCRRSSVTAAGDSILLRLSRLPGLPASQPTSTPNGANHWRGLLACFSASQLGRHISATCFAMSDSPQRCNQGGNQFYRSRRFVIPGASSAISSAISRSISAVTRAVRAGWLKRAGGQQLVLNVVRTGVPGMITLGARREAPACSVVMRQQFFQN